MELIKANWKLALAIIALLALAFIFNPIGDSKKIEKLKEERDKYKRMSEYLEAEKAELNQSIDSLLIQISMKREEWEIQDKQNEERKRTIPKERDRVVAGSDPDQLEFWENKRANARE